MLIDFRKAVMNPLAGDVHVDQMLTSVAIGARNASYIADEMAPVVFVERQSNIIPAYDQSHWFRDDAKLRGPGTESQGGGFTVNKDSKYFCDEFAWHMDIPDEVRGNTDLPFNMDRDAALFVQDKIALRRERAFAADLFTTGVWGTDVTGGTDFTVWSDLLGSQPLVDITGWQETVEGKIAKEPMHFGIGRQVWTSLKFHPDIVDSIKYTQIGKVTPDIIRGLADLSALLVGRALVTTSAENVAEASVVYSRVWGKHGLLFYRPERPTIFDPCAAMTFVWNVAGGAMTYFRRIRDDKARYDRIEGGSYFDQKQTSKNSGLFASGLVA